MLGIKKSSIAIAGAIVLSLITVGTAQAALFTFSINPKATFLRTQNDPYALDSVAIDLQSLGINGGDIISIEQLGDFSAGDRFPLPYPSWDKVKPMIGVFSASDILLPSYLQHRVRDAIDAGEDVFTFYPVKNSLPTDIPEDFSIDKTTIEVPVSVTHLFVSALDHAFSDNTDPDGDFAIKIDTISKPTEEITPVPEPTSTLGLFTLGAFGAGSMLRRKARQKCG